MGGVLPIKIISILISGEEALVAGLFVDIVVVVLLYVWVHNSDKLTSMFFHASLHYLWGREMCLVPGKVPTGRTGFLTTFRAFLQRSQSSLQSF